MAGKLSGGTGRELCLLLRLLGQFKPVFLCNRGLLTKPITVNLAFPLNIIGSGSNPACFDSFCLLCLLKLYLVLSQMRRKELVGC